MISPATHNAADPLADWDIIITGPTRAELVEDGEQVLIDRNLAKEAGFNWPVYMTSAAWESTIAAGGHEDPETGNWILPATQSLTGRLWDVLNLARYTIKSKGDERNPAFPVRVWGADGTRRTRVRWLYLEAGPVDFHDPAPCITIMTREDI